MKYRKRPVVIEAIQWTGENVNEIREFCSASAFDVIDAGHIVLKINTLEGVMIASKGDYIIKGVDGEFYPCKEDIFKRTYDVAEGGAALTEKYMYAGMLFSKKEEAIEFYCMERECSECDLHIDGGVCYENDERLREIGIEKVLVVPDSETKMRLQEAETCIAGLLWLNGNCEYCKKGVKDSYKGANTWRCTLRNAMCEPEWRGAE